MFFLHGISALNSKETQMLRKFLLISMVMVGVSCNNATAPGNESIKSDAVKIQKITVSDTILVRRKVIFGRIIGKNSSGKEVGAFSAIVCSDTKRTCVKTNNFGEYYLNFESPIQKASARSLSAEDFALDTTETPKVIDAIKPDTSAKIDKIDSTRVDTIKITYRKIVPDNTPDTLAIFKDSKKIFKTPITSWLNVLPDDYIVQRGISGKIIQNDYFDELTSVEAVFWSIDSIATIIPLEVNGGYYSGFFYQHYNDSSFKNSIRVFNLFVRILDKSDSVYGLTNVVNFSERAGDLTFADLAPGSIARYLYPNYFRAINDGSNVAAIFGSKNFSSANKKWYALDSLFIRPMFKDSTKFSPETRMGKYAGETQYVYLLDSTFRNIYKNSIDSIGFELESSEDCEVLFKAVGWDDTLKLKKGTNFFTKPKEYYSGDIATYGEAVYSLFGKPAKLKSYLHLK